MESSLEKFSTAVQAFSTYGIYLVAVIFGSLGLINSLGTELLPAVSTLYLAVFVNQLAFVNLEAYLSICVLAGILAVIPYIFRMSIAVDRYRLDAKA